MKKLLVLTVCILALCLSSAAVISAETNYKTYTEDADGNLIPTQDAYIPTLGIDVFSNDTDTLKLDSPTDFYYHETTEQLYVLDSGNKRIIILDNDFRLLDYFVHDDLENPLGITVSEDNIFVADPQAEKIFVFDHSHQLVEEITKPTSPIFGEDKILYRPTKVAVDSKGNLYVVSEGSYNGLMFFNSEFEFLSYFGANNVEVTLQLIFENIFLTDTQRANRIISTRPPSPQNVTIGEDGFIYTVSHNLSGDAIKKLNYVGENRFKDSMNDKDHYVSIIEGNVGNVIALTGDGIIDEFDSDGNLLFSFGGGGSNDNRMGLIGEGVTVTVNKDSDILVLDKKHNSIQVFERTEFTINIHNAISLYLEGKYDESMDAWFKTIKANSMFDLAHNGLGHGYYYNDDYENALAKYYISKNKEGYSKVFWEIRNEYIENNITSLFVYSAIIITVVSLSKFALKKNDIKTSELAFVTKVKNVKFMKEISFAGYFFKHPLDGFYEIKRKKIVSLRAALFWLLIMIVILMLHIRYTGFIFNTYTIEDVSIFGEILKILVPISLFVVANYLISTLTDGEGRISEIFIATIMCFTPFIFGMPLVIALSNILTYNESFLYYFPIGIMSFWSFIHIFFMIKDIHNFSVGEAIKNLLITIFTALIILLVLFIIYNIFYPVYDFIVSIYREVVIRYVE